jgi:hypothetical protein
VITLADPQGRPLQDVLTEDPRVRVAAFVAETFGMDPITVLAAPRDLWRIRLAAALSRAKANDPDRTEDGDA